MDDSEFLLQLSKIREFQLSDLHKADFRADANFLVCVGCLNAVEVLGGIRTGLIGRNRNGDAHKRFTAGLGLLPGAYVTFGEDLWQLRNSMIHSYLGATPKWANVAIGTSREPEAARYPAGVQVLHADQGPHLFVNVTTWTRDLATAWGTLLLELEENPAQRRAAQSAFELRLPFLR